jgi:fluoride exporter
MPWIAIGAGGALGAMARHALNAAVQGRYGTFPVGIFVVNALGCALIGVLAGLMGSGRVPIGEAGRLFLVVGVLGGFTTFSAFSLDTLLLLRGGHTTLAVVNAAGQVVTGVFAVWAGYAAGSWRM